MRTNSLNINTVANNAVDAKSITAYSHYLMMRGQIAGSLNFDGHRASADEEAVTQECRAFSERIARSLAACRECDIPYLLECYDIVYRIGYKRMPDSGFINRHKRRVLKAWKSGIGNIAESSVFGMIASDVSYHPERADREYYKAYISIKEKWVRILVAHSYFPDATAYENYQRLAMIMRENLDKELGNKADEAKCRWYEHNRVENLSVLSSSILRSYRRFAASLYPAVMDFDEKMALDCKILEELSGRQDLNPYDREAFRLALAFNRHLADD